LQKREKEQTRRIEESDLASRLSRGGARGRRDRTYGALERPIKPNAQRLATKDLDPACVREDVSIASCVMERSQRLTVAVDHSPSVDNQCGDARRPTIAAVPRLIEGASSGAGLGHAFLRHVERTRILVHVIDGSSRDPAWDHEVIRDELRAHDPALLEKPIIVAFNKLDRPVAAEAWPAFRAARIAAGADPDDVLPISAVEGTGLAELRERIAELLPDAGELGAPPEPAGVVVHRIEAMGDGFSVEAVEDGVFRVRGKRIERIAAQTNFDVEESAERFQRDLARLGIDDELRRAGIVPGDRVRIGAVELEWEAQPWEER
jgi:GTP-binding protein